MSKRGSYAEITMLSGAVITFPCTSLSWKRTAIETSLKWEMPEGAKRRPVHINIDEVAAVIFMDGSR